jgi:homogentisate 1,2-dioxygenase
MIYYVSGNFESRKGIEVGSITLHPYGIPHGPQPGLAERALGAVATQELAVMCDTFKPLRLADFVRPLDSPDYMFSWYRATTENPPEPGTIA